MLHVYIQMYVLYIYIYIFLSVSISRSFRRQTLSKHHLLLGSGYLWTGCVPAAALLPAGTSAILLRPFVKKTKRYGIPCTVCVVHKSYNGRCAASGSRTKWWPQSGHTVGIGPALTTHHRTQPVQSCPTILLLMALGMRVGSSYVPVWSQ